MILLRKSILYNVLCSMQNILYNIREESDLIFNIKI